jgi:hypothetical protein
MSDIAKLIPRIALGVVCLIASHAVFEVFHLRGWYPEQQLAAIVMVSPQTSFWVLSTVAAIGMWAGLDYLVYRRKRPLTDPQIEPQSEPPTAKGLPLAKQPLQIILGTGEPFETVEPSGANRSRTVRVKLQNNTGTEISNGTLKILNLDPANNGYKDFLLKDYITIGPHGRIFIGVAAYNEGTSEALVGQWIQLITPNIGGYIMPSTFGHLPIIPHTFHLNFSCLNGIYDEVYCRLRVDSDNVLHLERR